MGKIERFEDIEAWQMARKLTRAIYNTTKDGAFSRDFALRDQIRRASISIMSNIAEGFNRGGNKELAQFLFIAKGSTSEVQAQLYIALDADYIKQDKFDELYDLAANRSRILGGFIRYLKTRNSLSSTSNSTLTTRDSTHN
jgi:four helix bundle protein